MEEPISGDNFRYEDGCLYVKKQRSTGTGMLAYQYREINYKKMNDGTYVFTVQKTNSNYINIYRYHTALLYDKERDLRYWRLFSITKV